MLTTLLFDLDNTLIGNPTRTFVPAYLKALQHHTRELPGGDQLIDGLLAATRLVVSTDHPDRTNEAVIWDHLEQVVGIDRVSAEPIFNNFFESAYFELEPLVECRPAARTLIETCFELGYRVVIATNPIYPKAAIEGRLLWGDIPVTAFDYALVTYYENMHAAKPAVAYYEDILRQIGADASECLMIGDDWINDIVPANALGMQTWWLPPSEDAALPDGTISAEIGTLTDLTNWLISIGVQHNPEHRSNN